MSGRITQCDTCIFNCERYNDFVLNGKLYSNSWQSCTLLAGHCLLKHLWLIGCKWIDLLKIWQTDRPSAPVIILHFLFHHQMALLLQKIALKGLTLNRISSHWWSAETVLNLFIVILNNLHPFSWDLSVEFLDAWIFLWLPWICHHFLTSRLGSCT